MVVNKLNVFCGTSAKLLFYNGCKGIHYQGGNNGTFRHLPSDVRISALLDIAQLLVDTALQAEFGMCSAFSNLPFMNDKDLVGMLNGA
jgi:hypothetical protein